MSLGPSGLNYYYNVLCPLADRALQFAFACTLDRHLAEDKVVDTYRQFSNSLPAQGDGDTDLVTLISSLWLELNLLTTTHTSESLHLAQPSAAKSSVIELEKLEKDGSISNYSFLSSLNVVGRAVLAGVDVLGLDEEQMAFILKLPIEDVCKSLASARKAMLSDS